MPVDMWGNPNDTGHLTRAEVIGHAAANMAQQLLNKGMPPEEIARMFLVGFIGMSKSLTWPLNLAVRDLRERWDEVTPKMRDEKSVIEID